MNKKDIAVVIPIYLPSLSNSERISLEQCLKLLSSYSIVVIKPESLDLDDIINFFGLTHIEAFPDKHFVSLRAYNKLVLSEEFYRSFQHYTYMLIYQLDAYVFKDELLNWANKGYDYIGAPWLPWKKRHLSVIGRYRLYCQRLFCRLFDEKTFKTDKYYAYQVGNGGFTGPRGTYNSNGFTGVGFEIQIRENRMTFFIGKLYMLCLHQPFLHHQGLFIFMVLVFFLFIKNGKDPVRCCQGLLDIAIAVSNTLDGVCQIDGINKEGNQLSGRHNAVNDRHAAVPDNYRNGQGRQKFHYRRKLALLADRFHSGLEIVLVHLSEPFRFIVAAVEASDDADAGNGFLQHGRHISQSFLHAPAGGMEFPAEEFDGHRHQRHNDKAENGELPLEVNHGGKGTDENSSFLYQHNEIGGHGRLQGANVVGEITHDFTGTPFIKVGNGQLLQMLVELVS